MKRWQIILGLVLIFLGVIALVDALFSVNLWRFVGPLLLIGLGVLLVLRPRMAGKGVQVEMPILGDSRKTGTWEVTNHEFWWLVGSNRLDFTNARFPDGSATIKIFGFVADVVIIHPEDVGVRIASTAFVSELRTRDGKQEQIFNMMDYQTDNFGLAEKQVTIQILSFVAEVRAKPSLM